jgi:hypothetical protein
VEQLDDERRLIGKPGQLRLTHFRLELPSFGW